MVKWLPERKVTSWRCLFFMTNHPKLIDIQFAITGSYKKTADICIEDQNCCWFIFCHWSKQLISILPKLYIWYITYHRAVLSMRRLLLQRWGWTVLYSRCMYSCACGQHLCMCGRARGWQRKYMEINASSCSLCTSNVALLLAHQRSDRPRARGSKANETAIAQTHPADPWILIWLGREMEAGCLHPLNSSPIN